MEGILILEAEREKERVVQSWCALNPWSTTRKLSLQAYRRARDWGKKYAYIAILGDRYL